MAAKFLYKPLIFIAFMLYAQAAVGAGDTTTVTITKADCTRLVKHVPAPDVAFRPGVDVNGRSVVPADLNGGFEIDLPEVYSFDLVIQPVDFARRRHLAADRAALAGQIAAGTINPIVAEQLSAALDQEEALIDQRGFNETTMTVGRVTVSLDGQVSFNGKPLVDRDQAELAALCQKVLRR